MKQERLELVDKRPGEVGYEEFAVLVSIDGPEEQVAMLVEFLKAIHGTDWSEAM